MKQMEVIKAIGYNNYELMRKLQQQALERKRCMMAKGIIYVMTTVVPGLIKIGKTGAANFESRMYQLERHGYSNVVGLKRHFAIEVDDYDEKEVLLQEIFSKSKLENTELFALDIDLVVQLLSSFEGNQVYPKNISKDKVFDDATDVVKTKTCIPDGTYVMDRNIKRWGKRAKGTLRVEGGKLILLKGSVCCPIIQNPEDTALLGTTNKRAEVSIENDILQEDVEFNSVSMAAQFITYATENGWMVWKTKDGQPIDIFRK